VNDTLQFPLPLLAYGPDYNQRLEMAITFACFTTGQHLRRVLSREMVLKELGPMTDIPRPSKRLAAEEIEAVALGCNFCGIMLPDGSSGYDWRVSRYRSADAFLRVWKSKGRTVPWTRIPKRMAFEARDGTAKTYRRFAVLCAANAAIGSKPFTVVTVNRVRAGMLGYSSGHVLFDKDGELTETGRSILSEREDKPELLTRNMVRATLDNLVKTGLLHRFTPYRGSVTYYSKTLSAEMIGDLVLARAKRTANNPRLEQIGEQIRRAKQGQPLLCGDIQPEPPHNSESPHNKESTTQAPPDHHPTTTRPPHNAALNAALNASLNAGENAEGSRVLKNEEVKDPTRKQRTPEELRALWEQAKREGGSA
jgi:hypothetical protein